MQCAKCPLVSVADQLGLDPLIVDGDPALALLCVAHFKDFAEARRRRDRKVPWPKCVCGNDMYLDRPDLCERCRLKLARYPTPIGVTTQKVPVVFPRRWPAETVVVEEAAEPEPPIMHARNCPEDQLPRGIAPLLKRAAAAGWTTRATVAISGEGVRSVVCRYRRDQIVIVTSHEGDSDGSGMSFKYGWWVGSGALQPLGYRQVGPAIDAGEPPEDVDKDEVKAIALLGKVFSIDL